MVHKALSGFQCSTHCINIGEYHLTLNEGVKKKEPVLCEYLLLVLGVFVFWLSAELSCWV